MPFGDPTPTPSYFDRDALQQATGVHVGMHGASPKPISVSVHTLMDDQEARLSTLADTLDRLEGQLGPVLAASRPDDQTKDCEPEHEVALLQRVASHNQVLTHLDRRVNDVLSRLAV